MYDLYVPVESYQREISKLKQLAAQTADSKDMVSKDYICIFIII